VCLANELLKDGESARNNHVLACNFAKYSPILIFFTYRLNNKPFLIWLLITPPHLKCVATLPCNLSLMTCFADINVSLGSVATYAWCGGIFNMHLTSNLPRNLSVKSIVNRLRFDGIMVTSLWPRFWPTLYVYYCGWIRPICGYNFDFGVLKELAFNRKRTDARLFVL